MFDKTNLSIEICRPIREHARIIMDWRNHPTTLNMSFHHQPKNWESFWCEYCSDYFNFTQLPPIFLLTEGRRVAFIRFSPTQNPLNITGKSVDISLNVAPEERGKGLGKFAIELGVEFIQRLAQPDYIVADIKIENNRSRAAFTAAGFMYLGEKIKCIPDTGENFKIIQYIFKLSHDSFVKNGVTIIAEAGSNWRAGTPTRDKSMALALIDIAAESGADFIKFQTYKAETVYVENAGNSSYLKDKGINENIRDIFSDLEMPYELISELSAYCKKKGIGFMSTPFSIADFHAIDPYVQMHKIASYEIGHSQLIKAAATSNKPLILSTGACDISEIDWAVDTFHSLGGEQLCLLQCTAKYPAPISSLNLNVITWLKSRYRCCVGLSDHSRDPLIAPLAATALGAKVIEKHFTIDNRLPGPDHAFAILPKELADMVRSIRRVEQSLGDGVKCIQDVEKELALFAKRGIQAIRDIKIGDKFEKEKNIAILRPGERQLGAHPRYFDELDGCRSNREIKLGDGVVFGDWSKE